MARGSVSTSSELGREKVNLSIVGVLNLFGIKNPI